MSDWQERITRETAPAIRAEHELRYRIGAPLIAASAGMGDLGCGTGLAARGARRPSARTRRAGRHRAERGRRCRAASLALPDTSQLAGDLTNRDTSGPNRCTSCSAVDGEADRDLLRGRRAPKHASSRCSSGRWARARSRRGDVRDQRAQRRVLVDREPVSRDEPGARAHSRSCACLLPAGADAAAPGRADRLGAGRLGGDAGTANTRRPRSAASRPWRRTSSPRSDHVIDEMQHLARRRRRTDMLGQRRWERQRESNLALSGAGARTARAARADGQVRRVARLHPRAGARAWLAAVGDRADELHRQLRGRRRSEPSAEHGRVALVREGRVPGQRPAALGRGRSRHPARSPAEPDGRLGRDARARARGRGAELARLRAPAATCTSALAAEAMAEHYDVAVATWWETDVHAVRALGRPLRVLRAEPRGPVLPARRGRAARAPR